MAYCRGILVLVILCFLAGSSWAFQGKRDGKINLYHSHQDTWESFEYEQNGKVNPAVYERLNYFMRSRDNGEVKEMDIRLIHLLDHLQDHFDVDTVEVICGYRRPAFNKQLKEMGRNVADDSNHMRGIAADIHLDAIKEEDVVRYVRSLGLGGVGYYPDLLMVHVDFGRKSFWQEGKFSNKTRIGILNEKSAYRLEPKQLFNGKKATIGLVASRKDQAPKVAEVSLQWFYRGKWTPVARLKLDKTLENYAELSFKVEASKDFNLVGEKRYIVNQQQQILIPYGKFRLLMGEVEASNYQYSYEFYVKR